MGTLGQPGLTAYVGVRLIGKPKEGEVVFVSAAAGMDLGVYGITNVACFVPVNTPTDSADL